MPNLSSYPNGFPGGVAIHGLPILNTYGGNVFWVNSSGGSDGNKGTRAKPFATLDYAIGRCTANNGDVIILMPNHAETITGVGGITADIAGISILGMGTYNQRPRFLMDAGTTVDFAVSAADVTVQNCVFASGHSGVVRCFNITAAGCTLRDVEFVNNTTNENFLTPIKATSTTDNNADGLKVVGCRWITSDADDLEFIEINANIDGLVVDDNFVVSAGTSSQLVLTAGTKIMTGARITWNYLQHAMTSGSLLVSNGGSTSTGIIAHNRCRHADVTGAHSLGITGLGMGLFDNLSVSVDNLSGVVLPAIDVDL